MLDPDPMRSASSANRVLSAGRRRMAGIGIALLHGLLALSFGCESVLGVKDTPLSDPWMPPDDGSIDGDTMPDGSIDGDTSTEGEAAADVANDQSVDATDSADHDVPNDASEAAPRDEQNAQPDVASMP